MMQKVMVVAAFADFQVGIVPWRELDACCWNQVHKGVVRLGQWVCTASITVMWRAGQLRPALWGVCCAPASLLHCCPLLALRPGSP